MSALPVIDSHCHAWTCWPYSPPVPDPRTCARVEHLLYEMDDCGVDQALIVCARIKHNPRNNDYIATEVAQHPGRLHQAADLDCEWTATYHRPGAARRLREMAQRWPLKAFTHYLRREERWPPDEAAREGDSLVPPEVPTQEGGVQFLHDAPP